MLVVEKLSANAGDKKDVGWIPGLGRSPGGGHGDPLHDSCLENPMDRGAWQATVHRVAKSEACLKWLSSAYKAPCTTTDGSVALFILLPMFPCSNLIPWCKVLSPVQPLTPNFSFFSSWPLTLPDILLLFGYLRSLLLERGLQEKRLVPISQYSISGAWKLTSKPGNLSNSLGKKNAYISDSRSVVSDSCNLKDCSPPGSSVHGIFQERILEWVAISFSRESSQPRDWIQVCLHCKQIHYCLSHQGHL